MRVLYLNPFSQEVSGPDESLRTLLRSLIPLGVEAQLVLPRPGPQVPRYEALGVKVHYAPLTILRRRLGASVAWLPFSLARGVRELGRIVERERIDVIHTNMEVVLDGAVASRLLGVPHVLHYRGNTNDEPRRVFDLLTRFWTRTAGKVLCISDATADLFRKRGLGAKVETLYNPVDVDAFASAERSTELRRGWGAEPSSILIGTIGRIHPRKDVETFVRACALVAPVRADARFVIVGSAEAPEEVAYEERLRRLAHELGLGERLVWAGPRRDVPSVMKALDVFVLCSRNEGFGRVVAEAMAAGVAPILSREGAFPELVSDGATGILVEPEDPRATAEAALALAASPERRSQLGAAAARSAASRFDARRAAEAVKRDYDALLA